MQGAFTMFTIWTKYKGELSTRQHYNVYFFIKDRIDSCIQWLFECLRNYYHDYRVIEGGKLVPSSFSYYHPITMITITAHRPTCVKKIFGYIGQLKNHNTLYWDQNEMLSLTLYPSKHDTLISSNGGPATLGQY